MRGQVIMKTVLLPASSACFLALLACGCSGAEEPTLAIELRVVTEALPAGEVGAPYLATIEVEGGQAPYRMRATSTPPGLMVDDGGHLFGVPMQVGHFEVPVDVEDGGGAMASRSVAVSVLRGEDADVLHTTCEAPLVLSPEGSVEAVRAILPEEGGGRPLCEDQEGRSLAYIAVEVERAAVIDVELFGAGGDTSQVRVVDHPCGAVPPTACRSQLRTYRQPGRVLFAVEGDAGTEVAVLFRISPALHAATCDAPTPIVFQDGRARLEIGGLEDAVVGLVCLGSRRPLGVYEMALDEPSAVVVESAPTDPRLVIAMGSGDCEEIGAGRCDFLPGRQPLGDLEAGRYLVLLSGQTVPGDALELSR